MNDMTSALISTVVAALACGSTAAFIIMSWPVRAEPVSEVPLDHSTCACRIPPEIIRPQRHPNPTDANSQGEPEICPPFGRKPLCWPPSP